MLPYNLQSKMLGVCCRTDNDNSKETISNDAVFSNNEQLFESVERYKSSAP